MIRLRRPPTGTGEDVTVEDLSVRDKTDAVMNDLRLAVFDLRVATNQLDKAISEAMETSTSEGN